MNTTQELINKLGNAMGQPDSFEGGVFILKDGTEVPLKDITNIKVYVGNEMEFWPA